MSTQGQRLRQLRKKMFKSIRLFAEDSGISQATITAHEQNKRGISEDMSKKYAGLLGADWLWLYTGVRKQVAKAIDQETLTQSMALADKVVSEKNLPFNMLWKAHLASKFYESIEHKKDQGREAVLSNDLIDDIVGKVSEELTLESSENKVVVSNNH